MKGKRVHIVGSGPRTGTTLLTEVMKVCFAFDKSCEHEASVYKSNLSFGKYETLLTKQPSELFTVKWPLFFDKNLFVICLVRDPRDMACSYHGDRPDTYWCSLRYLKLFKRSYHQLKGHPRVLFIKYEDFVNNPDGVQQTIQNKFSFLRIKHPFSEYHKFAHPDEMTLKALRNLRPISPSGIGNWKKHLPRIKQQIDLHGDISGDLIEMGYEKDKQWLELLNGVEASAFPTETKEFFSQSEIRKRKRRGYLTALKIIIEKTGINADRLLYPLTWLNGLIIQTKSRHKR
ncbi:MAG: sulfotransferase domain-containing protein [Marinilabilia sp.]